MKRHISRISQIANYMRALIFTFGLLIAGVGAGMPCKAQAATPAAAAKIKHIVLIIQENRSFDNLFSGFPGSDSVTSGLDHTGKLVPFHKVRLEEGIDVEHNHSAFLTEFANGAMNGFDLNYSNNIPSPDTPVAPTYPLAYVDRTEVTAYWTLAQRFTLADHMFQSQNSETFTAHLYLVAGQAKRYVDNPTGFPWGCDAPAGTKERVLDNDGTIDAGEFPCTSMHTLADDLDAKHVSWAYYAPAVVKHNGYIDSGAAFSAFDAVKNVRYGKDWANVISPQTKIFDDIRNGRLRRMTWVVPASAESDHPASHAGRGPSWVADIANAVGASRYWKDTAIIVLWDDWGGWYDHVPPPHKDDMGLGFRVPMLIVSPYSRAQTVSHTQYEFGSILKFVEHAFGLASLGTTDARAASIEDSFDFSQPPLPYGAALPTSYSAEDFENIYNGLYGAH